MRQRIALLVGVPTYQYANFAHHYPLNGELKMQDKKVEAMADWCNAAGIKHTPTFYFNGYRLPDLYQLKDLAYFMDE